MRPSLPEPSRGGLASLSLADRLKLGVLAAVALAYVGAMVYGLTDGVPMTRREMARSALAGGILAFLIYRVVRILMR